jgi:hypothetical protein
MKLRRSSACLLAIFLQSTTPGWGHHATAAQYDISRTITLKGVVSKLDWANPHAHLRLDVKNAGGKGEQWDVELGSPGAVIVSGLSKEVLMPGATLTVVGYPGKSNASPGASLSLCVRELTLADGSKAEFVVGI